MTVEHLFNAIGRFVTGSRAKAVPGARAAAGAPPATATPSQTT